MRSHAVVHAQASLAAMELLAVPTACQLCTAALEVCWWQRLPPKAARGPALVVLLRSWAMPRSNHPNHR